MSVSVVIPSCGTVGDDGEALLAGALAAVDHLIVDEIVVVTTGERMTDEGRRAIRTVPGVRLIDVQDPFIFSVAVNAGAAATTGEQILLLNDDIALTRAGTPDWVARLAAKKGGVKGVMLLQPDERTIEHAGVWFTAPGGMPCHIGQYEQLPDARELQFRDGPQGAVTAAAMMTSRRTFNRVHGFDEAYPLNYGDVDYCLRVQEKGGSCIAVNKIRLVHRESSTRKFSMPLEEDFHRLAAAHRGFLSSHGVVVDEYAAARYRRQVLAGREAQGLPGC